MNNPWARHPKYKIGDEVIFYLNYEKSFGFNHKTKGVIRGIRTPDMGEMLHGQCEYVYWIPIEPINIMWYVIGGNIVNVKENEILEKRNNIYE